MTIDGRRAVLVSAAAYAGLTMAIGHRVLGSLSSRIASDAGDPLLTAAILTWNATHVPGTDAWWQFPIFHPTADALAFSDHLLGLSVVAAPLYWLTGSTVAAYNLTLLLTYPLCGLAMFALVYRLTRSAPAAFLAGLAFAFAPYRASRLPHIQLLAVFWAPLALAGLHAYLESGRRRWLALFAACWMLQGATSGYLLIYFSLLVGLWIGWFLIARRQWRDVGRVAVALTIAALPLAPLLYRYASVHARHGFSRQFGEAGLFGADIAAVLCAPAGLTFWSWLRIGCRVEGEIFVGAALIALLVACFIASPADDRLPAPPRERPVVRLLRRLLVVAAAVLLAVAAISAATGGWRVELGPLRASSSGFVKPLSAACALLLAAGLMSPSFLETLRRGSTRTFYLGAALCGWVLAWGPAPRLLGADVLYQAPYAWLMLLPGGDSLRVPARIWMMVALVLAVALGLMVAELLQRRARLTALVVAVATCGLVLDGWTTIGVAAVPGAAPNAALLRGATVMELPVGDQLGDIAAEFRAVTGGWRTVNGFSGYEPASYDALRKASAAGSAAVFGAVRGEDLHVLVPEDASELRTLVEEQPGAEQTGNGGGLRQYRIPAAPP